MLSLPREKEKRPQGDLPEKGGRQDFIIRYRGKRKKGEKEKKG